MKCNACYSDNMGEAKYCRECGRDIAETYINAHKNAHKSFFIGFFSVIIFVAAAIICIGSLNELFEDAKISEKFVNKDSKDNVPKTGETIKAVEYIGNGKTAIVMYKIDKENKEVPDGTTVIEGQYKAVDNIGGRVVVCEAEGGMYYACLNNVMLPMPDCHRYSPASSEIAPSTASINMVFINSSNTLYVAGSKTTEIAQNVKTFMVSHDGKYCAYYVDDELGTLSVYSFSSGSSTKLCEEPNCDEIIYMSDSNGDEGFAIFYRTGETIRARVKESKDEEAKDYKKYFQFENAGDIVVANNASLLLTKSNGGTYLWENPQDEEKEISKLTFTEMIKPFNYEFTGSDFYDVFYWVDKNLDGEGDTVVKLVKDDKGNRKVTEVMSGVSSCQVSADCRFVFCLDGRGTVHVIDTNGQVSKKTVGKGITDFALNADSRTFVYIQNENAYLFDGQLIKPLLSNSASKKSKTDEQAPQEATDKKLQIELAIRFKEVCLSKYGYIVLVDADNGLYVYRDREVKMIANGSVIRSGVEILSTGDIYYVEKIENQDDVVKWARSNGTFTSNLEELQAEKNDTTAGESTEG